MTEVPPSEWSDGFVVFQQGQWVLLPGAPDHVCAYYEEWVNRRPEESGDVVLPATYLPLPTDEAARKVLDEILARQKGEESSDAS